MDYSIFDSLLDSVFIVDNDRRIEYCNEPAATLCQSSVRRLTKGKRIFEIFEFPNSDLFITERGQLGKEEVVPFQELSYKLIGKEQKGRIQVAIQPFNIRNEKRWVVLFHDVTLEEVLHGKYRRELEGKEKLILELQKAKEQLQEYSKGLEQMVAERTKELNSANRTLSAIMNSLGQGFLVFDKEGFCGEIYTKICEEILESRPARKNISEILRLEGANRETLSTWIQALFSEALPFDSMKELGPEQYHHSQGKKICLNYHAIRNDDESIENVVMVATDKTDEYLANQALEREKERAKMIVKIVTSQASFNSFFHEIPSTIAELKDHVAKLEGEFDIDHVYRNLHSLEGMAATFSTTCLVKALKHSQELLSPYREGVATTRSQFTEFLKSFDLVTKSYQAFFFFFQELLQLVGDDNAGKKDIPIKRVESFLASIREKKEYVSLYKSLEEELLKESLVEGVLRQVITLKSTAESLGKKLAPVKVSGQDVRIFQEPYMDFFKSLVHLFRNIADHGLETPEEREMSGKSVEGLVEVSAFEDITNLKHQLKIVISDDGKGIDVEKIRKKLVEIRPQENWNEKSDFEVCQTIFDAGLSTKDTVSEFSGRGVGMDAVQHEVNKMGGSISVFSEIGKGTRFEILLPSIDLDHSVSKAA
ncbi:MAG: PAS domain-containing protein [Bdellovibrionales bacterium]|nr:PAS domain-containing protein [Bdellovibrionales bacterium]